MAPSLTSHPKSNPSKVNASRIMRLLFLGHIVYNPVVILLSPPNDSTKIERCN